MALDKDGRSAIPGSKLTGDCEANCTGANDLGGEDSQLKRSPPAYIEWW